MSFVPTTLLQVAAGHQQQVVSTIVKPGSIHSASIDDCFNIEKTSGKGKIVQKKH